MGNRFVRDTLVLAAFCGVFYLVTLSINWFGSGGDQATSKEYSWDRTNADYYSKRKEWPKAAEHFKRMTEDDQFNQHAWYFLGDANYRMRFQIVKRVYNEEYKSTPDQDRIARFKASAKELTDKAAPAFKQALKFPRYRNKSRYRLARMYAFDGDGDAALKYLKDALDDGFVSNIRGGIGKIYDFAAIAESDEFKQLQRQENANARQRRNRR